MRRSKSVRFFDFSGGLNTRSPVTSIALNQAADLQNINLLPSGGWEKRRGNSVFNSSAMNGAASIIGLGYYRQADADEWLVAIAGTKIFSSSSLSGTMSDISGSLTITAGNNNIWTHSVMNDLSIFVGGSRATDVPIKYSGTGNAAALGGTPPVGNFGITANNRFFIGNTVANPSRINWSILGNPEDWSGAGSGSQDISTSDGDALVGAARAGVDHLLLFKQNSIHDLIIRSAPFPFFPLFRGVGAVGKRAIIEVDGIIYFITPEPRMKATDGTKIIDFPDTIDTTWDGLNVSRLPYIQGLYNRRLGQICWICSNGSSATHNYCIVWDLKRKCWLRHTTGFGMNVVELVQDRFPYGGAYAGKVYQLDMSGTTNDASESSAAINGFWKTGWYDMNSMISSKSIPYVETNFTTQASGTFDFGIAYDFSTQTRNTSVSMVASGGVWGSMLWGEDVWGGQSDKSGLIFTKGRGKFVQFLIRNQNQGEAFSFNGFEVPVELEAPALLS